MTRRACGRETDRREFSLALATGARASPFHSETKKIRSGGVRSAPEKAPRPKAFGRAGEKPEKTARQESKIPLNPAPPPQSEARRPRPAGSRDESNS